MKVKWIAFWGHRTRRVIICWSKRIHWNTLRFFVDNKQIDLIGRYLLIISKKIVDQHQNYFSTENDFLFIIKGHCVRERKNLLLGRNFVADQQFFADNQQVSCEKKGIFLACKNFSFLNPFESL